ncbi:nuclear protein localization protein 4 [Physocladia obscura]|uniref:Nuclear protein localization protein 4 n=1 Tax=Physocladia obscura TaxID=109957 RepID=A0AAD5XCY3_9FUNG|nr:nuclear protein localization protein 4 [Physocladia obscura]
MLYVSLSSEVAASIDAQTKTSLPPVVKQAPIDDLLIKSKGTIQRKRDPNFCRHGDSGMCDYCMPVEPYDPKYLEQNKIKHMSFHAYLKQALIANKTAPIGAPNFLPPLEEPSYALKNPCPGRTHEAYPKGLCSKCQPSAITLTGQNFRMVDHVEFETPTIVENFIKFWRSTGAQRFGLLYGHYETYIDKVPLGVKAVVSAIYEPPQENTSSYLQLQEPNKQQEIVNSVAGALGLDLIGMIYTDVIDDGTGKGQVICKRHAGSYFMSSAEALFSAHLQGQYPVACKYSSTGKFGSRFVTCIVSGNEDGGIDVSCFQISNVGVGMVRDNIVEASVDPQLVRVKTTSNDQYIPEVFYKFKNEYGIQVKEAAKPTFPVDYLLITGNKKKLSHGFPQDPRPIFKSTNPFPIENRNGATGDFQDMHSVHSRISSNDIVSNLSDFHLLIHLAELGFLEKDDYARLLKVVQGQESFDAVVGTGSWQTLAMVAKEAASEVRGGFSAAAGGNGASGAKQTNWTCRHCTFNNLGGDSCDVCGLPKDD